MKKVVAFLEQYAEWVGLGVACLFLLYMVYAYVVSPDALKIKVGNEAMMPGDVDPFIQKNAVTRLQNDMEASGADLGNLFKVKDFSGEFARAMGPQRARMAPEYLADTRSIRPTLPGEEFRAPDPKAPKQQIARLPIVPAPTHNGVAGGNSVVASPPPPPVEGEDAAAIPPPEDPNIILANALDKTWHTVEWKFDSKALADDWKKVFYDPKTNRPLAFVPTQVLISHFLQLEAEREELVGPGQWSNSVVLKPLPLIRQDPYPREGDREAQEKYRIWAETHQVDIVEPMFHRILKGDQWYIPSVGLPKDPALADANLIDQPFDPATTTIPFEKQTPQQKQAVYIYKQQQKAEQQKAEGQARKAKAEAADAARKSQSGGGGTGSDRGGGGRRIGGYNAPLPEQYAAGSDVRQPGVVYGDDGRPLRNQPGARPPGRLAVPDFRRDSGATRVPVAPTDSAPVIDPTSGMVQNPALSAPFDPSKLLDFKGNAAPIMMWAHDDTAVPGKTYRYRARVKMKNPLYNTSGLTQNQQFENDLAIKSDWSGWKEVKTPPNTIFFFSAMKQGFGSGIKSVTAVTAEVFKHQKGEWSKETFIVYPGDGIGATKNNLDYTTGVTLVDLRPDTREKDLRIMVADEMGNIDTISYLTQLADPFYKSLQEKVNKSAGPAGVPAAGISPALINEVGAR